MVVRISDKTQNYSKVTKLLVKPKFIDDIYLKKDEESQIPYKNVIKTDSNLKMEVFKEIAATIGIDDTPYILKKMLIDQRLLGNRNKIAHGERFEALDGVSTVSDYLELHMTVLELIDQFASNIKEAANNMDYKV